MLDYLILLEKHHTLNLTNREGWTPAHLAGALNNFDSLNLLMEYGASIVVKHDHKLSCYEEIVRSDNADLLECIYPFVEQDQNARSFKEPGSFSILHLAAGSKEPKCLEFLMKQPGISPNLICNQHERSTPLHFAILANNLPAARILLRNGANPNAKDAFGNTPMHVAVTAEFIQLVRELDEFGANATEPNVDGICPIDIAITEDLREMKLYFTKQSKYRDYDMSGHQSATIKMQSERKKNVGYFTTENTKQFKNFSGE